MGKREILIMLILAIPMAGFLMVPANQDEPIATYVIAIAEVPNKPVAEQVKKPFIFNKNNLREKSNMTVEELNNAFDVVNQPQMKELSMAIIDAESYHNINGLFLAALIAEESGWMKHPAGNGNNLTGYGVYVPTSKGTSFNSKYDNIMATAGLLDKEYLDNKGKYYNGMGIENVNIDYCLNTNGSINYMWSKNISKIANMLRGKLA